MTGDLAISVTSVHRLLFGTQFAVPVSVPGRGEADECLPAVVVSVRTPATSDLFHHYAAFVYA